ncbi:MAG: tryptophan--tRNA ligase [Deltaproteobacteria bacterium]|jgi:tryptophanyl-tRNA synthetase|nr:tryptophan--tRNA ligase [Deltaproteobacteria bacterium]MBT4526532.1 tryptophan--tRNA ligase [Deltaproteobacteria bacterium]
MKNRIFSGIQPSGDIHIGNYIGAIRNWAQMMDDYECIFCIVDYHAMAGKYDPKILQQRIMEAATVNIACGLDPDRCAFFVQSHVIEHTELTWMFNCVTPIGELQRMTQFKDKSKHQNQNINVGLLDYPVLMAADILIYKAEIVPVGEDQIQHIELCREIARKFNATFGETFPEPQAHLGKHKRIMGLDGKNKMSKSLNNYIGVLDTDDEIWKKLKSAFTDENRIKKTDPGNPDICNIYSLHDALSEADTISEVNQDCRKGRIGCVDCKKKLHQSLSFHLTPIRDKADFLFNNPDKVQEILKQGAMKSKKIAEETMREVRIKTGFR